MKVIYHKDFNQSYCLSSRRCAGPITDMRNAVVLQFPVRVIVVSPADPHAFVRHLHTVVPRLRIGAGEGSEVEALIEPCRLRSDELRPHGSPRYRRPGTSVMARRKDDKNGRNRPYDVVCG